MKTNNLLAGALSFAIGIGLGYVIFKGKEGLETVLKCEQGEIEKKRLICIPTVLMFDEMDDDLVYMDFYTRASSDNSVGFSLSSSVLEKLYFKSKSNQNQEIDGFRIYPGIDESK